MNLSTVPATARTDVDVAPPVPPTTTSRAAIRTAGAVLAAGTIAWASAGLYWGFDTKDEVGRVVGDLTGFLFQCGVLALLHVQMRTRATGVKKINRRALQVEHVLLGLAMLWSLLHAALPSQRDAVWLGILDVFWPLSMFGMFLIGMKIAFRGRWRGAARVWSAIAETWAVATVPLFIIFGDGASSVVGSVHLLLGYTVLGLILVVRPDLTEDRG